MQGPELCLSIRQGKTQIWRVVCRCTASQQTRRVADIDLSISGIPKHHRASAKDYITADALAGQHDRAKAKEGPFAHLGTATKNGTRSQMGKVCHLAMVLDNGMGVDEATGSNYGEGVHDGSCKNDASVTD